MLTVVLQWTAVADGLAGESFQGGQFLEGPSRDVNFCLARVGCDEKGALQGEVGCSPEEGVVHSQRWVICTRNTGIVRMAGHYRLVSCPLQLR